MGGKHKKLSIRKWKAEHRNAWRKIIASTLVVNEDVRIGKQVETTVNQ